MMETAAAPRPISPVQPNHAASLPRTVRVDSRLAVRLGVVFMVLAGMLLAVLGGAYYRIEADNERALMRADSERILRLSALAMTESLAEVMSDLRFLSHSNELDAYLLRGEGAAARGLAREFAALITQKRNYDQIRFIDPDGRERVRVNHASGGARITPADQLQAKGSRYYFEALTWLNADDIYVSPMDLNVERGQIERPLKPMIRFGVAIYDQFGMRRGYLVINYLAERLLNKLRELSGNGQALRLLDAKGEWLLGPDVDDAWAGQLPERQPRSFAKRHPAAWEAMRQQASGSLSAGATNLQFLRVYPLYSLTDTGDLALLAQPAAAESYFWYALIENLPTETTASHSRPAQMAIKGGIVMALLLLVVAASSALAYAIARQRALARTLEQAVDNVPVLIAYLDAEQRFRFNNRAYLDTYGITPKGLYGKHLREILGEDGYAKVLPRLEQALAGERMEFELHLDNGPGPRDLSVTYVPDVADNGKIRGIYALIGDITQRLASEQRERDHMLELAQVSRLASVGEVTREIAHQINQPLAAIAMFSNAAQRTLESAGEQSKLRDWMEAINTQAKRASEVVQRLRRFATVGELKSAPLDLNGPVREVVALAEPEASARRVELSLELADALPAVQASGILMEQVIYNLVHSAIRAAADQAQPGRVTIRTHADASKVWVDVLDNGPWIDRRQEQGLTEPDTDQADSGLGIGLSISRSIVTSYQGDMICQLNAVGGTRVCFSLPRLSP